MNTLKVVKEQDLDIKYGTVDDTLTERVLEQYSQELKGAWSFGFPEVSQKFKDKIEKDLATYYGAAITYSHIKQMGRILSECGEDKECIIESMDNVGPDNTIGFEGFVSHVAELDMQIKNY